MSKMPNDNNIFPAPSAPHVKKILRRLRRQMSKNSSAPNVQFVLQQTKKGGDLFEVVIFESSLDYGQGQCGEFCPKTVKIGAIVDDF